MSAKLFVSQISDSKKYSLRFIVISPFIFFLLFIILTSLITPYLETRIIIAPYEWFNVLLGKICHQYPSHSFYIFGSNMGLCARCFSIYLGMLIFSVSIVYVKINVRWTLRLIIGLVFCIPLIIDGTTQLYQLRMSTNSIRLMTGLFAGFGISIIWILDYISFFINSIFRKQLNMI